MKHFGKGCDKLEKQRCYGQSLTKRENADSLTVWHERRSVVKLIKNTETDVSG